MDKERNIHQCCDEMDFSKEKLKEKPEQPDNIEPVRALIKCRHGRVQVRRDLTPAEIARQKIGRNAPCICGSGKKLKHCCIKLMK